ncbi:hypothetical protein RFI_20220 [Reticulomyxa filosa]|uniref:Uncharacterized protein n=1 Tax=Reticulomyxa filosa TaxID=46433 RepID=X6MVI3_RETFI|nr:hypothetical protein RFI_20220 [Reticulomyxa filosa]|eukprot:ETO17115.1 hypothetical protein RFI_20220 [Reticulomyxa filosa]
MSKYPRIFIRKIEAEKNKDNKRSAFIYIKKKILNYFNIEETATGKNFVQLVKEGGGGSRTRRVRGKKKKTEIKEKKMSEEQKLTPEEEKQLESRRRRESREEKFRKIRERRASDVTQFEHPVPLYDSKTTEETGRRQSLVLEASTITQAKKEVELSVEWKAKLKRWIESESEADEERKKNEAQAKEWNELEIHCYCQYWTKKKEKEKEKGKEERKEERGNILSSDFAEETDIVYPPQRLISNHSVKGDFNDLSSKWKGAALYRRECKGVYSWGDNYDGQVGRGADNEVREWRSFDDLQDCTVQSIQMGEDHTAYVTSKGGLRMAGNNDRGQCGEDPEKSRGGVGGGGKGNDINDRNDISRVKPKKISST